MDSSITATVAQRLLDALGADDWRLVLKAADHLHASVTLPILPIDGLDGRYGALALWTLISLTIFEGVWEAMADRRFREMADEGDMVPAIAPELITVWTEEDRLLLQAFIATGGDASR